MTADTFIRDRFAWLDQILSDPDTPAVDLQVAYIIATRFLNREKGYAWMSVETLAKLDGRSARRVQETLSRLKRRGHLEIARQGKGNASHYRMMIQEQTKSSDQETVRQDEIVLSNEPLTGQKRPIKADDRTKSSAMIGRNRPPTSFEEPFEEDIRPTGNLIAFPEPSPKRQEPDNGFDNFWTIYPRKDSKGRARPAFAAALKKAPLETILAGAKRYATERQGKDAQYTKLPTTWLNGECWGDQSLAANTNTAIPDDSQSWSHSKFETAVMLAKKNGFWSEAYGPTSRIPPDLIDAELQAILTRPPKPISQVVA